MKKSLLIICLLLTLVWENTWVYALDDDVILGGYYTTPNGSIALSEEVIQKEDIVSYNDLLPLFSIPADQFDNYLSVKNPYADESIYGERDYCYDYISNASGRHGNISYSFPVYVYGYDSNDDKKTDISVTSPEKSSDVLHIQMHSGAIDGAGSIGLRDVQIGDSYTTVLEKLGFPAELRNYNRVHVDLFGDHTPVGWVSEEHEIITDGIPTSVPTIELNYYQSFKQLGYGGRIVRLWWYDGGENLERALYWNDALLEKLIGITPPTYANTGNEYVYDKTDPGEDIQLPVELLDKVTNASSASDAVKQMASGLSNEQKNSATGKDLATLYAETAVAKAASKTVGGSEVIISAAAVKELDVAASEAAFAVEAALVNGGVTAARYLSNTVTLTTNETGEITIKIDPDILTTEVDKIRVETPTYALTLKTADLKEDLTEVLTITAEDVGSGFAPGKGNQKTSVKINLPKGRTTNPVTISLPTDSGATTYQAVVKTDGTATASKYNPATTAMDGKINTSGTYTVQTNEKSFTDISNKSAEMQKAILYLTSKGIINGTSATEFSPDGTINRQQIAALLMRALGKVDNTAKPTFTDVPSSSSLYHAIASSQKHKIINGYSDNTFRGTNVINRSQIVTVAGRVLTTEMNYKTPFNASTYIAKYSDTVPDYAKEMVALATRENLVVYRTDGTFSGAKNMTRGDAAIILYRLFQKIW